MNVVLDFLCFILICMYIW